MKKKRYNHKKFLKESERRIRRSFNNLDECFDEWLNEQYENCVLICNLSPVQQFRTFLIKFLNYPPTEAYEIENLYYENLKRQLKKNKLWN